RAYFKEDEDVTWEDTVRTPKETLTGFVPAPDRRLLLEYPDWGDNLDAIADSAWGRIDKVEVRGPTGAAYRVRVAKGETRIPVPGLSCDDHVSYRYVGNRRYREKTARITSGTIALQLPEKLADDRFGFGIALGGGGYISWLPGHDFERFYGVVEGILV